MEVEEHYDIQPVAQKTVFEVVDNVCLEYFDTFSISQQLNLSVNGDVKCQDACEFHVVFKHCGCLLNVLFVYRTDVDVGILGKSM